MLFDEADGLVGEAMVSFLTQLRDQGDPILSVSFTL